MLVQPTLEQESSTPNHPLLKYSLLTQSVQQKERKLLSQGESIETSDSLVGVALKAAQQQELRQTDLLNI